MYQVCDILQVKNEGPILTSILSQHYQTAYEIRASSSMNEQYAF